MGVQVISGGEGSLEFSAILSTDQFEKGTDKLLSELEQVRKKMTDLSKSITLNPQIDVTQVKSQIAEVEKALSKMTASGLDTGRIYHNIEEIKAKLAGIKPLTIPANVDTSKAIQSIETLRAKLLLKQQSLIETTDITKAAALNKEITGLQTQIAKIANAGKTGFDDLGNALGKAEGAVAKTAKSTNVLSKGFGFIRQAAYLIPGIGIAGIFNVIGEAVVALISSLTKGAAAFDAVKAKVATLGKALESTEYTNAIKNVNELRINIELAKDGFLDKTKVLHQYNDTIGKTTGKVASLEEAEKQLGLNADAYIKMTLYKAAANLALEDAAKKSLEAEKTRLKNLDEFTKTREKANITLSTSGYVSETQLAANAAESARFAKKRKDDEIKINEDAANANINIAKNFQKKAAELSKGLKFDFFGGTEDPKKVKAARDHHEAINKLIAEQKTLLEQAAALERDSLQSGLIKEASTIDKINEKYDQLIKKATLYNKEVAKNPDKNLKDGVRTIDVSLIQSARAVEVRNEGFKQEAVLYIKNLDVQQKAFQQYEQAKKDISLDYANQTFGEQTKGFTSYLSYLKAETAKLGTKISLGIFNVGDAEKLKAIVKETLDAQVKQAEQDYQNIQTLLKDSASFGDKRNEIEEKFTKNFETLTKLRSKIAASEYDSRLKLLQEANEKELTELNNQIIRQSAIYKKLNTDIIGFSRSQIKTLIKSLQTDLANGFTVNGVGDKIALSPQMKKDLKAGIDQLKSFYKETSEIFGLSVDQLEEMARKAADVGSIFSTLANALGPLNSGLGKALSQISDMAGVAGSALSGISSFASGDYLAAAQSAANIIASVGKVLAEAKQSKIDSRKAVEDFYSMVQAGELETNLAYRERLRTQKDINGLKLKGIEDENKELSKQRAQSLADYNRIFAELQKQQYVSGESTKKGKGSLLFGLTGFFTGLGGKTTVEKQYADLLGMNFGQIEKLFNSGQLTDRAKELFQQLQKLKQEGIDIDQQLAELKKQQDELFTGATVDSITDSIIEGFKNGKRSAADFADTFQELMKTAVFNALKYKTLEPLLADFYAKFSAKASDIDGLTAVDIADLQALYDEIIKKTSTQFEQLAGITKLNFGSSGGTGNALAGGIKAITETTAQLLAGQFGGLRMTALDQLTVARQNLDISVKIERNTATALISLASMDTTLKDLKNFGIKVKP